MHEEDSDHRIGLFDLDGTLANYEKAMRYWLDLLKSPGETDYEVHAQEPKYFSQRQRVIRRQPGFWLNLERVQLGFDVLAAAQQVGFRNFHACTRGPTDCSSAWSEKYDWVQRYKTTGELPADMKITITEDKGTVYGRFLCDDHLPYLERWLAHRKRGLGILVVMNDHTTKTPLHPQIVPYNGTNMDEVKERLRRAFHRNSGEPM
jgi:hypothetical protein